MARPVGSLGMSNRQFKAKLDMLFGDYIKPVESYKGSCIEIKFKCIKGHYFASKPKLVYITKNGCKLCGLEGIANRSQEYKLQKGFTNFTARVHEKYGKNSQIIGYTNTRKSVTIICDEGHRSDYNHAYDAKYCRLCFGENSAFHLESRYKKKLFKLYGNKLILAESYIDPNYAKSASYRDMKHICHIHGEIYVSPQKTLNGKSDLGCQKCNLEKRDEKHRIPIKELERRLKTKHGTKITVLGFKNSVLEKHDFLCNICGNKWKTTLDAVLRVTGCAACNEIKQSSKVSIEWIEKIAEITGLHFWHSDNGGEAMIKVPEYRRKLYVDGYNKDYKIVLEFHGDCWHGNPNLYGENDFPHPFKKDVNGAQLYADTKAREDALAKAGYQILTIREADFKKGHLFSNIKGPEHFCLRDYLLSAL